MRNPRKDLQSSQRIGRQRPSNPEAEPEVARGGRTGHSRRKNKLPSRLSATGVSTGDTSGCACQETVKVTSAYSTPPEILTQKPTAQQEGHLQG